MLQLKRSIETLHEIRLLIHKDLNPCVAAELDAVIYQLEQCVDAGDSDVIIQPELVNRTIILIGRIVETVLNISELIACLTDPR
jgi:hypothetical protein